MTIPVSTAPAAIRAILTAIQAVLATAGETSVAVVCGTPSASLPNTLVSVATAIRRVPKLMAMVGSGGPNFLEESYTVDVEVTVAAAVPGGTAVTGPLSAVDRAWQLVGYVETAVRNDPSLTNTVLLAYPSGTRGGRPRVGDGAAPSRVVNLVCSIRCTAAI